VGTGFRKRSRTNKKRDPEKWAPVFGKDHARTKSWNGMMTRLKIIPL
jgi:hypothetical protein